MSPRCALKFEQGTLGNFKQQVFFNINNYINI